MPTEKWDRPTLILNIPIFHNTHKQYLGQSRGKTDSQNELPIFCAKKLEDFRKSPRRFKPRWSKRILP